MFQERCFAMDNPPRMDKTVFEIRRKSNVKEIINLKEPYPHPTLINFFNEKTCGFSKNSAFVCSQISSNTADFR